MEAYFQCAKLQLIVNLKVVNFGLRYQIVYAIAGNPWPNNAAKLEAKIATAGIM